MAQFWILIIILICIGLVIYSLCCGKGDKIGTWVTTREYANGRESISERSAYGPDYESAYFFCLTGANCFVLFGVFSIIIGPLLMGIFVYVYNLIYLQVPLIQYFVISDFVLN